MKKDGLSFATLLLLYGLPAHAQDRVCNALRAAAPEGTKTFVGPTVVLDRGRVQGFLAGGGVASYRAGAVKALALTDDEMADLAKSVAGHAFENFEPDCNWTQDAPNSFRVSPETPAFTFTNPLFSSDGNLALIARSRFVGPLGSSGALCALRRKGDVWTATCFGSWIS